MKLFRLISLILVLSALTVLLSPAALALSAPSLNGQAAVLIDLDAGRVLYGYNKYEERAPASLT